METVGTYSYVLFLSGCLYNRDKVVFYTNSGNFYFILAMFLLK